MAREALSANLIGDIFDAAPDNARWGDFACLIGKAARIEHTGVRIADGGGVRDISLGGCCPETLAAVRGITITTLPTHLAKIFARTGAENQRDLVRLFGMLPPLRTTGER